MCVTQRRAGGSNGGGGGGGSSSSSSSSSSRSSREDDEEEGFIKRTFGSSHSEADTHAQFVTSHDMRISVRNAVNEDSTRSLRAAMARRRSSCRRCIATMSPMVVLAPGAPPFGGPSGSPPLPPSSPLVPQERSCRLQYEKSIRMLTYLVFNEQEG